MNAQEFKAIEKKLIKEGVPVDQAPALAIRVYNFALMNQVSIEDVIYHMEITKK
jgi:hypothetical protein